MYLISIGRDFLMIVLKRKLIFMLLFLSMYDAAAYLDEHGVPRQGLFGFRGLQKNIYCAVTFNWSREKAMLDAFEAVLKNNDQNALKIFKEKFYAEDCGRHPQLIQKAIEHNRPDLLQFMQEKGLNVRDTFKEYCVDRTPEKTYFLKYPLHALIEKYGDQSVETIAVMTTRLKFDQMQKDDRDNILLDIATRNKSLQVQKKLIALSVERDKTGDTPLHIAARLQPPSAYEALFEELLKNNFDVKSRDAQGKTVNEINNEQEEYYCNPLNNGPSSSEEEINARIEECKVCNLRKKKHSKRLAKIFIETDRNLTDEQNAEISRKTKEEREFGKKQGEEEATRAEEAEKIAREALLRKKLHDENDVALALKEEQFIENKNAEHEKRKHTILNFYDDND